MPLLFSLGQQHPALQAVQAQLLPGERVFAYLDDMCVTTTPARVGAIYRLFERELWIHANIRVHGGKTRVWNSGGHRPAACDELERISRAVNGGNEGRGSQVPSTEQGIKVLGCPQGHTDFVDAHLERTTREHSVLLGRIPSYFLRVLPPTLVRRFAEDHDDGLWSCLCQLLGCLSQPERHRSGQCHSSPFPWRVRSQKRCADI